MLSAAVQVSGPVIIVGGGSAADCVRLWHRRGLCSDAEAHWTAIAAMTFHARQLADRSARFQMVSDRNEADAAIQDGRVAVLDIWTFLRQHSGRHGEHDLPVSWDVTSDSIAAWVAARWRARLLLLKSVDPGNNPLQHVDAWFVQAAAPLRSIGWMNLRRAQAAVQTVVLPKAVPPSDG